MVSFKAVISKFGEQGEKTGWVYIKIPAAIAQQLNPGNKKAFRVKGKLDEYDFEKISLIPFGGGDFIMALNATIRKGIRKTIGDVLIVKIEVDERGPEAPPLFLECLREEPQAWEAFQKLAKSHQHYFINWIIAAKTEETIANRIAHAVNALQHGLQFGEMIRKIKKDREDFFSKG